MKSITFADIDVYILTGDVGGTNTSLGLVHVNKGQFSVVKKHSFQSKQLSGFDQALETVLDEYRQFCQPAGLAGACFTIAGPVVDNAVSLTNLDWNIDGNALAAKIGLPVYLINDISGICYGLPLVDHADPNHILCLAHPDGTFPAPRELKPGTAVQAVVAPGTGMGVGYLIKDRGNYLALPAEAGHIDWGAFSRETRLMQEWMHQRLGINPGVEEFISGRGIANIFQYFVDSKAEGHDSPVIGHITAGPQGSWGGHIASYYGQDHLCSHVMDLFIEMLARYASAVALWMLPQGGLYLAGGVPAKNRNLIMANNKFIKIFLQNYQPGMTEQLKKIPVFMSLDYGINLPGAAHAFLCLNNK